MRRLTRRAVVVAGVCGSLLCLVYVLAVWTRSGQFFEDSVLDAYLAVAAGPQARAAVDAIGQISVFSLAGSIVSVFAIGLSRGRPTLALASAGVVAASVVGTEVVKLAAYRPFLLESGVHRENQSFPSGHTAVALSVMCGLVLVVPYRMRVAALFLSSLWGIGIAVATVTGNWHRPSDTIGSGLITLICTCAAIVLLAGRGRVRQAPPDAGRAGRRLLAALYALTAAAALAIAAVRQDVLTTGWAIALAGGCLTALTLLTLLGTADLAGPAPAQASIRGTRGNGHGRVADHATGDITDGTNRPPRGEIHGGDARPPPDQR